MKITTSKGKTLDVNWIFGPTKAGGNVMIEITDNRPISEVAADFEGCDSIKEEVESGTYKMYEGYTDLKEVSRKRNDGKVIVSLYKP